ncbi:MAG: hypothetical protein QXH07_07395 [Thermoplasmata archaeon]
MALFGKSSGIVSTGQPVNNQLVASFGSIALNSNLQPQNMVQIPNYNGLPMSSFKISLNVTDTTGSTAPSGVFPIETVIKELKIQTNNGINIVDFDGALFDISNTARYLNPVGLINNSPTPADSAASTSYTADWELIVPFGIDAKYFPLKLFFTAAPLSYRATTLNGMTSTINSLKIYASYHPISIVDQAIVNQTIPVPGTGTINLQPQYPLNRTMYMQAYVYGAVQSSSATDSPIGVNGSGITFSPNGALNIQNAPLQTFIDEENTKYANTVSAGVGHEVGMVNLFTPPFVTNAATQFSIDFTSAPSTSGAEGQTNQIRSIWLMNLQ